jgi:hypothetical protein
LLLGLWALPAWAHWADLAVAEIELEGAEVRLVCTFPTALLKGADADGDGQLAAGEIDARLRQALAAKIQVLDGGQGAELVAVEAASPLAGAGSRAHSTLQLVYRFPAPPAAPRLRYQLFEPGVATARCLAQVTRDGRTATLAFTPAAPEQPLGPAARPAQEARASLGGFLLLGIEHILLGWDHGLFLVCLLLLGGGLVYLVKVVTAFTVAHSLTLSLAVLGLVHLPSRPVESLIALSILYVALENFWRRSLRGRWMVVFFFGLVHGLGFAGVLQGMQIPRPQMALALFGFNLGVEVGQVAIVAAAWLLLALLRRLRLDRTEGQGEVVHSALRRVLSGAVAAVALGLFLQRAFLGG